MATKAPTKKVAAKKAPETAEKTYSMPMEVHDWIERANSIINHQKGEIERLKAEIKDLKSYKKWAEHRILRSDQEE